MLLFFQDESEQEKDKCNKTWEENNILLKNMAKINRGYLFTWKVR